MGLGCDGDGGAIAWGVVAWWCGCVLGYGSLGLEGVCT